MRSPRCESAEPPWLDLVGTSTSSSVREMLHDIRVWVSGHVAVTDCVDCVEIVLAEVLNNIVEHAYQGCGEGAIRLHVTLLDRCVSIEVRDDGLPMPERRAPEGQRPAVWAGQPVEDLPEGGFGWSLIRNLCHDVDYHRRGGENRLRVTVPLG